MTELYSEGYSYKSCGCCGCPISICRNVSEIEYTYTYTYRNYRNAVKGAFFVALCNPCRTTRWKFVFELSRTEFVNIKYCKWIWNIEN